MRRPPASSHHHDPARQLEAAAAYCEQAGEKFTPLRRKVLELVIRAQKPVKAYELLRQLSTRARDAKPPTVYRTLDFLLKIGLVHRVASLDAFMACCHPRHAAVSQLLVCGACGGVEETESGHFADAISRLAAQRRFQPGAHTVEIQGVCAACQPEAERGAHV